MANTDLVPDVRVEEIVTAPSAPVVDISLTPILISPCYRAVRDVTILPAGNFTGSPIVTSAAYPILDPGAIVDYSSVELNVINAVVQVFVRPMEG